MKKGILENFAEFTGKHLCQSLFFNIVVSLSPVTLFKKRLWHRCFPVNFAKFSRSPFFTEHLWRLLLIILVIIHTDWSFISKKTLSRAFPGDFLGKASVRNTCEYLVLHLTNKFIFQS